MRRKVGYLDASGGFVARGDEEVAHNEEEAMNRASMGLLNSYPDAVDHLRVLFVFFSFCVASGSRFFSSRETETRCRFISTALGSACD